MRIRIVTWNIAGCRKVKTLKQFDYEEEDLKYFSDQLKAISPDIVCLQEVETSPEGLSQAWLLSKALNLGNVFFVPTHSSHINSINKSGNSILSKEPFLISESKLLPYPDWPLKWPDGRLVKKFDKKLLFVSYDKFEVCTLHLHPLGLWGFNYNEGRGIEYSVKIEETLMSVKKPAILCGDFSGDFLEGDLGLVFKNLYRKYNFTDVLKGEVTRPRLNSQKRKNDHILISSEFKVEEKGIVKTETDHYLCWADISLK